MAAAHCSGGGGSPQGAALLRAVAAVHPVLLSGVFDGVGAEHVVQVSVRSMKIAPYQNVCCMKIALNQNVCCVK